MILCIYRMIREIALESHEIPASPQIPHLVSNASSFHLDAISVYNCVGYKGNSIKIHWGGGPQ